MATAVPDVEHDVYAVVLETDAPALPVALAYGLNNASEDVVILQISW